MRSKTLGLAVVAVGFALTVQSALAAPCAREERVLDRAWANYQKVLGDAFPEPGEEEDALDAYDIAGDAYDACMDRTEVTADEAIDFGLGALDAITGGSGHGGSGYGHGHSSDSYQGHSGRSSDGGFWIGDEYGPSLLKVDAEGRVSVRWVPAGTESFFEGAACPAARS